MTDLRERVAQAIGQVPWDDYPTLVMADAAIALIVEECAKRCESVSYSGRFPIDDVSELACLRCRDAIRALAKGDKV